MKEQWEIKQREKTYFRTKTENRINGRVEHRTGTAGQI
jgi:hypothetical protein